MGKYLYNVQYTVEVEANSEDEAYELLLNDDEAACTTIYSDILLVEKDID